MQLKALVLTASVLVSLAASAEPLKNFVPGTYYLHHSVHGKYCPKKVVMSVDEVMNVLHMGRLAVSYRQPTQDINLKGTGCTEDRVEVTDLKDQSDSQRYVFQSREIYTCAEHGDRVEKVSVTKDTVTYDARQVGDAIPNDGNAFVFSCEWTREK